MESKDWNGFGYFSPDFSPGMPGVPADLDPPRFGPPKIWTPRSKSASGFSADLDPSTKLSENIILKVLIKMDDTLRSRAY